MNYVGVDVHKKYSVLCALDERGRKLREARVEGNTGCGFAQFFRSLEGASRAVVEACWSWGRVQDVLEGLDQVEEVVLAQPGKPRLIADAQIKTARHCAVSWADEPAPPLHLDPALPARRIR